jgi:small subunit ribosomal protein S21
MPARSQFGEVPLRPGHAKGAAGVDSMARLCYPPAETREVPTPRGRPRIWKAAKLQRNEPGKARVQIIVRDNNVDQALKVLKKKMQREGIFREMKLRDHYEKPSEKRAREAAEAVRRARKLARKKLQREGLIAAPKKPAAR